MSCNGCRVLRKGCSESCILRPCIQWIQSAEAQGHATVFVAKFFGRAGLMSFISAVPESQSPALFQSLLYEACGRTVNPVNGAVGLLSTGNWNVCQAAVETVLRGGSLRPIPELLTRDGGSDEASEICMDILNDSGDRKSYHHCRFSTSGSRKTVSPPKRKRLASEQRRPSSELGLSLISDFPVKKMPVKEETCRPETPSIHSEESVATVSFSNITAGGGETTKLLNLFT
ncbi:unnamed protein product [Eruca vesicaria subsp. sativa]|uniref:LOB domain-containing protein n=1 Tax=Eruca vesicaria subsp. sativa TaxID=29727 RepID=A0ABC8J561_ERUVS|nr:unnamed protein product [Eruca vesicaria subsp. sativa]